MKKTFKAWVVLNAERKPLQDTISFSRNEAERWAGLDQWPTGEWSKLRAIGYRCVRCTVTIDEKGKKRC